jgi:nitrate reductase NapE component
VYAIRCAAADSKTRTQKMFTQHMTLFLQITFLFYPTLSLMQVGGSSGVGVRAQSMGLRCAPSL